MNSNHTETQVARDQVPDDALEVTTHADAVAGRQVWVDKERPITYIVILDPTRACDESEA